MPRDGVPSVRAQQRRAQMQAVRRRRRIAGLVLLAAVGLVVLLLTAFGSAKKPAAQQLLVPAPANRLLPSGPPSPQVVALEGSLRIQLPIAQSRVTAIGYHASGDGALSLQALGTQANAGALTRLAHSVFGGGRGGLKWFQIPGGSGPGTAALDVGAAAGTDVYAPVDGSIIGITPYIVNGKRYGSQVDIQPTGAPSLVLSVTHVKLDPALTVGSSLTGGTTKLGTVVDFSQAETQALAQFTQDAGNHVELEAHSAAALGGP